MHLEINLYRSLTLFDTTAGGVSQVSLTLLHFSHLAPPLVVSDPQIIDPCIERSLSQVTRAHEGRSDQAEISASLFLGGGGRVRSSTAPILYANKATSHSKVWECARRSSTNVRREVNGKASMDRDRRIANQRTLRDAQGLIRKVRPRAFEPIKGEARVISASYENNSRRQKVELVLK